MTELISDRVWISIFLLGGLLVLGHSSLALGADALSVQRSDGAKIPIRAYLPAGEGCPSLTMISPGAGGTEKGYSYLGEGLRSSGWMVIVIGHRESGPATLRKDLFGSGLHEGLEKMVQDPVLQQDRLKDIDGVFHWAETLCPHPYKVLVGHSMGSDTVMFEAGARNKIGVKGGLNRFDAYVAISPAGPGPIFPDDAWNQIHKPVFILTGTRDKGLEGSWEWRAKPFAELPPGCKWLGVIDGATHLNFAGIGFSRKTERLTLESISLFLSGARTGGCQTPRPVGGIRIESN